MAELTTFATERRQPVSWVELYTPDRPTLPVQLFSEDIDDQAAYDDAQPATDAMISDSHASLVPLGSGGVDLAHVMTEWAKLRADHRTFHDYLTLRRREMSTSDRAVLLSAVPALEAFHDQLYGPPPRGRKTRSATRYWPGSPHLLGSAMRTASTSTDAWHHRTATRSLIDSRRSLTATSMPISAT